MPETISSNYDDDLESAFLLRESLDEVKGLKLKKEEENEKEHSSEEGTSNEEEKVVDQKEDEGKKQQDEDDLGWGVKIIYLVVFIFLDCAKAFSTQWSIKGTVVISHTVVYLVAFLSVALGFVCAALFGGREEIKMCLNWGKICENMLMAIFFAGAQCLQAVQNVYLTAGHAKIISQVKLPLNVFLAYLFTGRTYTFKQIVLVVILAAAVIIFQLFTQIGKEQEKEENNGFIIGAIITIMSGFFSVSACLISERLMKKDMTLPFYVQKFHQECCTIVVMFVLLFAMPALGAVFDRFDSNESNHMGPQYVFSTRAEVMFTNDTRETLVENLTELSIPKLLKAPKEAEHGTDWNNHVENQFNAACTTPYCNFAKRKEDVEMRGNLVELIQRAKKALAAVEKAPFEKKAVHVDTLRTDHFKKYITLGGCSEFNKACRGYLAIGTSEDKYCTYDKLKLNGSTQKDEATLLCLVLQDNEKWQLRVQEISSEQVTKVEDRRKAKKKALIEAYQKDYQNWNWYYDVGKKATKKAETEMKKVSPLETLLVILEEEKTEITRSSDNNIATFENTNIPILNNLQDDTTEGKPRKVFEFSALSEEDKVANPYHIKLRGKQLLEKDVDLIQKYMSKNVEDAEASPTYSSTSYDLTQIEILKGKYAPGALASTGKPGKSMSRYVCNEHLCNRKHLKEGGYQYIAQSYSKYLEQQNDNGHLSGMLTGGVYSSNPFAGWFVTETWANVPFPIYPVALNAFAMLCSFWSAGLLVKYLSSLWKNIGQCIVPLVLNVMEYTVFASPESELSYEKMQGLGCAAFVVVTCVYLFAHIQQEEKEKAKEKGIEMSSKH